MENQQTPEGKTLEEKAKAAVDYKRQVAVFGEQAATNAVQLWTLGYQSGLQEANEINVCFSKPYQNLQRELFGKKKEIESHQEANAELREKNEDLQIMSEAKDMALVELKEANAKLVEANKELVEIAKAYYEHLKTQDHIHGLNTYSDRMKSKITALLQTYETK